MALIDLKDTTWYFNKTVNYSLSSTIYEGGVS